MRSVPAKFWTSTYKKRITNTKVHDYIHVYHMKEHLICYKMTPESSLNSLWGSRALAHNSKCKDNMCIPTSGRTFPDFGQTFHKTFCKILWFLVTRLSEVLGHNVRAVSEFYTSTAKKARKMFCVRLLSI